MQCTKKYKAKDKVEVKIKVEERSDEIPLRRGQKSQDKSEMIFSV
jgi:hypothetical protein